MKEKIVALLIGLVLLIVPVICLASHQITYFEDNMPGAVSLTFDDGYQSQATTGVSALNARNLKGTFFIHTFDAWIDSHVSWDTWQAVAAQGHEIASHTGTEESLLRLSELELHQQFSESQTAINQNIPG